MPLPPVMTCVPKKDRPNSHGGRIHPRFGIHPSFHLNDALGELGPSWTAIPTLVKVIGLAGFGLFLTDPRLTSLTNSGDPAEKPEDDLKNLAVVRRLAAGGER